MTILEDPVRPFDPSRLELVETEPETDAQADRSEPVREIDRSSDRNAEGVGTDQTMHDEPECAGI